MKSEGKLKDSLENRYKMKFIRHKNPVTGGGSGAALRCGERDHELYYLISDYAANTLGDSGVKGARGGWGAGAGEGQEAKGRTAGVPIKAAHTAQAHSFFVPP